MPAQSSGLETFGGGTGGNFGLNPNLTTPNVVSSNTPFRGGVANAGVGTGNLGQFGGYIPTPLNQFNNYQDYLAYMPGAQQMNDFANIGISPSFYQFNPQSYAGYMQNIQNNPFGVGAMTGAEQATQLALGGSFQEVPITNNVPGPNGTTISSTAMEPMWVPDGQGGFVQKQWLPAANQMFDYARTLGHQGEKMFGLEDPIIAAAFDPQNALYQRTQQQLQDQTRAGLAARGLSMDPYGAGVEGSTMSNFNIDWQNNLLNRMATGAQAVGGLAGVGGELMGGAGAMNQAAAGLQSNAMDMITGMSRLPMDVWNEINNTSANALQKQGTYGQEAAAPFQQAFKNWQDIQNQFLTANQQSFNQNQTAGFEDPFAMLQLQSEIEMQREQMNMQEEMQKKAMQNQMAMQGAQAGLGMLGGMGGK